ncbi:phosphotransferase [Nesterenkonia cremea]|nr:phosphotransferase [Nesterenkonia cremea]
MATAAVPGLSPTGVAAAADDARDFTAAIVHDAEGNRWRIRSPQHQEAAMRLETELQVLRGFSTAIRAELPFRVPSVAGAVRRGEMRTFVYNHLPGASMDLAELTRGPAGLIDDIARTIAAIHDLSDSVVDHADLPRYSAERYRQRRLNELDQAATTGQIPAPLLRRWEHAMEDQQLWDFEPTVTHGDLHEDSLLIEGERVVAVTGWTDLHIGDPADDFAWLTAVGAPAFRDQVLQAYGQHRSEEADPCLMRRAALTAEFALAQWLVRGKATENQEMVDEALGLLNQLASDIETYGGQPIALTPMEEEVKAPAETQDSRPVARVGAHATVADNGEWAESGEGDVEPAVITDSSADGSAEDADTAHDAGGSAGAPAATDEDGEPTGQVTPLSQSRWADPDDEPTGQYPAVPADEETTGTIPPVQETVAEESAAAAEPPTTSGSLPIQPDQQAEQRAKQKNFFPAQSANSARSAGSAETAGSARTAGSASSACSATSAQSAASAAEAEQVEEAVADQTAAEHSEGAGGESIYSRHPGLRPPQ